MNIRTKRIYLPAQPEDGFRVLVDRLWPRGVSKAEADLDAWLKDIAPSTELRKWFAHDPAKMSEFATRYRAELDANPTAVGTLQGYIDNHPVVTLLYGARDTENNEAVVLADYMRARSAKG